MSSLPAPATAPRLVLLGMRASGKTTLGARLAAQLGVSFLDLDILTARLLGQPSAGDAIRHLGLPAFRAGEVRALQTPEAANAGVLSLGGGTPTDEGARAIIQTFKRAGSKVVYLRAQPAALQARLARTDLSSRPSLTGANPIDEVEALFKARDPIFRTVADTVIDVDHLTESAAQAALQTLLSTQ